MVVGVRLERSVCVYDVLWLCGLCLFVFFCGEVVMLIGFFLFLFLFFQMWGLQGLGRERLRVSADGCFSTVGFSCFLFVD